MGDAAFEPSSSLTGPSTIEVAAGATAQATRRECARGHTAGPRMALAIGPPRLVTPPPELSAVLGSIVGHGGGLTGERVVAINATLENDPGPHLRHSIGSCQCATAV